MPKGPTKRKFVTVMVN